MAKWTDSIFNAGVPLHPTFHTGVLPAGGTQSPPAAQADPEPAGVHHYPTPIADIQLFKYDDFQLWVTDDAGQPRRGRTGGARGVAETRKYTCFTPRQAQRWPSKSRRPKARTPR